ncbi:MAG: hypothetical protein ACLU3I_11345 [Acutalibacteraceae bacterium]
MREYLPGKGHHDETRQAAHRPKTCIHCFCLSEFCPKRPMQVGRSAFLQAAGTGLSGVLPEIPGIASGGSTYPNERRPEPMRAEILWEVFTDTGAPEAYLLFKGCGPRAAKRKGSGAWTT